MKHPLVHKFARKPVTSMEYSIATTGLFLQPEARAKANGLTRQIRVMIDGKHYSPTALSIDPDDGALIVSCD